VLAKCYRRQGIRSGSRRLLKAVVFDEVSDLRIGRFFGHNGAVLKEASRNFKLLTRVVCDVFSHSVIPFCRFVPINLESYTAKQVKPFAQIAFKLNGYSFVPG
jgi:hypothetical protein